MSQPQVILILDKDGNPSIEVIGGNGKTCKDLTQALEEALGTVEQVDFKPEFSQAQARATNDQNLRA